MASSSELVGLRCQFARAMLAIAGVADPAVEQAFARVERELFLGPKPWHILGAATSRGSGATEDPAEAYADVLFALDPEHGINNGSPSLHALLLHALAAAPGDRVAHIGAGTGYYTAMLAEIVGPAGHVTAVEIDTRLADLARANLRPWSNVTVVQGDGASWPSEGVARVYVNFAVGEPAGAWIEQLTVGGRLVFPLGVPVGSGGAGFSGSGAHGAAFLITRHRLGFAARWLSSVAFVHAEGALARPRAARDLARAFRRGGEERVRSLRWGKATSAADCWFSAPGWSLCFDPPAGDEEGERR